MRTLRRPDGLASLLLAMAALVASGAAARGFEADNEVTRLIERLDVMAPQHYRGLTVFPLRIRSGEDGTDYAALDEAFRGGFLRVSDTGSVGRVTMQNTSHRRWVFAMAGEVILGGKQNRMLREDVLLPPNSRPVVVATYCVEKDRWTGDVKAAFKGGYGVGNYALRRKALARAPQAEVWAQVDEEQRRFRVPSATKDFHAVMNDAAVQRELASYRTAFVRIWRPRTVGIVVARGGRIVSADVFGSSALFWKLRHKLVDSYAFDCVGRYQHVRPSFDQRAARDFMARLYSTAYRGGSTPGSGSRLDFSGNGVTGAALSRAGLVVHLDVRPTGRPVPVPIPRPPIRPLPEPR